jgi:putative acetyltransferase
MQKAVTIRSFRATDIEAVYRLLQMPESQPNTLQIPYASFEQFKQRFSQPDPSVHSLVAELADSGEVVGNLGVHRHSNLRRAHAAEIGMSVHDDFQGQGIGTQLMAAAVALADNWLHISRLELTVFTDNAPAIGLYEKFGFEKEGVLRAYAIRAGQLTDVYTMARLRL